MEFLKATINKRTVYVNPANVVFVERGELGGVCIHFRGDLEPRHPRLYIDRADPGAGVFISALEQWLGQPGSPPPG